MLMNFILVSGIVLLTLSMDIGLVKYVTLNAKIKHNTKHYHALFINQVQLIKLGFILVAHKVGALGQQLLTIAHKIHQRVLVLLRQGN